MDSYKDFVTLEMVKRVCGLVIRVQLGHAEPVGDWLLDLASKRGWAS